MEKVLWLAALKVRILPRSPIAMDGSEFAYGEFAGFASSQTDMELQLKADLEDALLEIVELLHVSPADEAKWVDQSEYKNSILDLLEEVKITGNFTSGIFRSSEFLGMEI